MASPGEKGGAEKRRLMKASIEGELRERESAGVVVFWTNFTSSWQKISAGTGRAKRLGKGVFEALEGLSPKEALDELNAKVQENFGVCILGGYKRDQETTDAETDNPPERYPRWASPLGHAAASAEGSGVAWASPMGHAASQDEGHKGKGPTPTVAHDPWASFLPKGWGPPKGSRAEAEKGGRHSKGQRKAYAMDARREQPSAWGQRLRQKGQKASKGKTPMAGQPPWEKGSLLEEEWNVEVITQEDLLERDGVALVSRQFLLEFSDTLITNGGPSAAIIPSGLQWFENKPRTEILAQMLNRAEEISFNYAYQEDGVVRTRPKEGHLIQLAAWEEVVQKTGQLRSFHAEVLDEITLEFFREAMPPRKWEEVTKDPRQFIERVVASITDDETLSLRMSRVRDKGDSMMATVKIPPESTMAVLTNADRHHLFARVTLRDDAKDQGHEPIWLNHDGRSNFLAFIREIRESGLRHAGAAYRGICMRRLRDGAGLQAGVRVVADQAPVVRCRILPNNMQPPEEAKNVIGRQYYKIFGLPLDMTKRSVSAQLYREVGWAVLPVRELVRAASRTATWVVAADDPPSEWRFFARFGGSLSSNVITIEAEEGGAKGRNFVPNRWARPQPTGPLYFNPYHMDQDTAMADVSETETIHYQDGEGGNENREANYESAQSAQESLDGAWGIVSKSTRRKAQGKPNGKGSGAKAAGKGDQPSVAAVAAAMPPAPQRHETREARGEAPQQDASVWELVKALREDATRREADAERREAEAVRRHQEQAELIKALASKCEFLGSALAQTQLQAAALNSWCDNLTLRLNAVEAGALGDGPHRATPAAAIAQGGATVGQAVPVDPTPAAAASSGGVMGDAETLVVSRGRKGARSETPSGDESEIERPRAKKPAQEEYESAVETEENKST